MWNLGRPDNNCFSSGTLCQLILSFRAGRSALTRLHVNEEWNGDYASFTLFETDHIVIIMILR